MTAACGSLFVFFFQAEDGIRDLYVTGVQTCALPISALLRLAGAVEADSEHPLARAIVVAAEPHGGPGTATDFHSITGRGVQATVGGVSAAVGGPALLRELGLEEPRPLKDEIAAWRRRGAAVLYVASGGKVAGALALEDELRPESKQAVDGLHRLGKRVVMITGDARQVAESVAERLGVDESFAEVPPEDRSEEHTSELQS